MACLRLRDISGMPNDGPKNLDQYIDDVEARIELLTAERDHARQLAEWSASRGVPLAGPLPWQVRPRRWRDLRRRTLRRLGL